MAWLRPRCLSEALEQLDKQRHRIVCGGTDLFVNAPSKANEIAHTDWLDVRSLPELKRVSRSSEGLEIGAAVTAAEIWGNEIFSAVPALQQAARIVGGWQIQNRASIGGNVANASPAADMLVPLFAYRAEVRLTGAYGTRSVPIEAFVTGPKRTELQHGELITSLFVPARMLDTPQIFLRHDQRAATDISIVSIALILQGTAQQVEWGTAAIGAAAPKPYTLSQKEDSLWSGEIRTDKLESLGDLYAQRSSPITDIRAGAAYRRSLVKTYTIRAAQTLLARMEQMEGA
jgi:CO/xanthine dehydrogenase FAD-binding subunit